ncbi:MAG: DUF692 domain-containing protein [Gammaproteobacteria bacterium]
MKLSAGLNLKPPHFAVAEHSDADGLWFEVHPENFMAAGGPRATCLERLRARHPLSLHGVGMSLGSHEMPDRGHLARLRQLCERVAPVLVSEHLAWSRWQGQYLPDLLPMPRTGEALACAARNVSIVQDTLGREIALENPSHYLHLDEHEMTEIEFLDELRRRTGCGLLVDITNIHVSANNLGFSAATYLDAIPGDAVREIHLAGYGVDSGHAPQLLIDSHDCATSPTVWALYQRFIKRIGPRPTIIERDENLPDFATLMSERGVAAALLAAVNRPLPQPQTRA